MTKDTQEFIDQLRAGQLQQLFDYLPGIYFVVKNNHGRVMMANELAVRLCGFEHEDEMVGKLDHDIFSPQIGPMPMWRMIGVFLKRVKAFWTALNWRLTRTIRSTGLSPQRSRSTHTMGK